MGIASKGESLDVGAHEARAGADDPLLGVDGPEIHQAVRSGAAEGVAVHRPEEQRPPLPIGTPQSAHEVRLPVDALSGQLSLTRTSEVPSGIEVLDAQTGQWQLGGGVGRIALALLDRDREREGEGQDENEQYLSKVPAPAPDAEDG